MAFYPLTSSLAEDTKWSGEGDAVSWEDGANWTPAGEPAAGDDATIDSQGADVVVSGTFAVKSLQVGGKKTSAFKTEDFVNGDIAPPEETDDALHIRKGGSVTLTGEGVLTLKGTLRNTEKKLEEEPAFMFSVE